MRKYRIALLSMALGRFIKAINAELLLHSKKKQIEMQLLSQPAPRPPSTLRLSPRAGVTSRARSGPQDTWEESDEEEVARAPTALRLSLRSPAPATNAASPPTSHRRAGSSDLATFNGLLWADMMASIPEEDGSYAGEGGGTGAQSARLAPVAPASPAPFTSRSEECSSSLPARSPRPQRVRTLAPSTPLSVGGDPLLQLYPTAHPPPAAASPRPNLVPVLTFSRDTPTQAQPQSMTQRKGSLDEIHSKEFDPKKSLRVVQAIRSPDFQRYFLRNMRRLHSLTRGERFSRRWIIDPDVRDQELNTLFRAKIWYHMEQHNAKNDLKFLMPRADAGTARAFLATGKDPVVERLLEMDDISDYDLYRLRLSCRCPPLLLLGSISAVEMFEVLLRILERSYEDYKAKRLTRINLNAALGSNSPTALQEGGPFGGDIEGDQDSFQNLQAVPPAGTPVGRLGGSAGRGGRRGVFSYRAREGGNTAVVRARREYVQDIGLVGGAGVGEVTRRGDGREGEGPGGSGPA